MSEIDAHDTPSGTIDRDLSCMICGYNLRGLAPDSTCPECGADIARSTQGDLLKFADRNWLGGIYKGTLLLSVASILLTLGVVALLVLPLLYALQSADSGGPILSIVVPFSMILLAFGATAIMIWGVWLVTRQEPRQYMTEESASNRRLARAAIIAIFIFYGLASAVPGWMRSPMIFAMPLSFVVGLVCSLRHLEMIGGRVPNGSTINQARRRRKGLTITGVGCGLVYVARWIIPAVAGTPQGVVIGLKVGFILSSLCLFFSTISAIAILPRFRPILKKALDDAGTP